MLGHASAVMTLDTYTDLFDDDIDAVAKALDTARTNWDMGKKLVEPRDTPENSTISGNLTAEGVGFEPTRHFCPPVFKTGSIGRSDSPPGRRGAGGLARV